jgi:hypothetical protein
MSAYGLTVSGNTIVLGGLSPTYSYPKICGKQIRVIWLWPGVRGDPLFARVEIVDLDRYYEYLALYSTLSEDEPADWFEAISYVWGSSHKPCSLITSNGVIPITESLHSVLHDLRLEDRHRCLWADGICINQEDSTEKANQVALMGEIYSSCRRVLVYLGPQEEDTDGAFDLIRAYWRNNMAWGIVDDRHLGPVATSQYLGIDLPDNQRRYDMPSFNDERWQSVKNLFSRPWFHRMWVVQEFILGRDVVMMLGRTECHWREIWAAAFTYGDGPVPFMDAATFPGLRTMNAIGNERRVREREPNASLDLFSCIVEFGSLESTLPHDIFYGFLGLGKDGVNPSLYPDYSASYNAVNKRITRVLLFGENGHEVLMNAGIRYQSDLPSWVPDWRRLGRIGLILGSKPYDASRKTIFMVESPPGNEDVINVMGRKFDTIVRITRESDGSDWYPLESVGGMQFVSNCIKTFLTDSMIYPTREHLISACWRTIVGDRGMNQPRASDEMGIGFYGFHLYLLKHADGVSGFPEWEDLLNTLSQIFKSRVTWHKAFRLLKDFRKWASQMENRYKLLPCRTERGYIGLVPTLSEPEDQVWVIRGCRVPLVLRENASRPGYFQIVGTSYVHGIMDGEAFNNGEDFQVLSLV